MDVSRATRPSGWLDWSITPISRSSPALDRHEIFHAAHDAHRAADLLIALELHKSLDQALAHFTEPHGFIVHQPISDSAQILHSTTESSKSALEVDL